MSNHSKYKINKTIKTIPHHAFLKITKIYAKRHFVKFCKLYLWKWYPEKSWLSKIITSEKIHNCLLKDILAYKVVFISQHIFWTLFNLMNTNFHLYKFIYLKWCHFLSSVYFLYNLHKNSFAEKVKQRS